MFIEVRKLDLMEGEEVLELGGKVMNALAQNRKKLKRSLSLRGIFNDHIVAKDMESGKLFRMSLKRNDSGEIELGELEEVRQVFVSAKQAADMKKQFVCPECNATGEKAGDCPKCGTAMQEKTKKVEKSMDDMVTEAKEDLELLELVTEIQKSDAKYIDIKDPDDEDGPKESIFKGVVTV